MTKKEVLIDVLCYYTESKGVVPINTLNGLINEIFSLEREIKLVDIIGGDNYSVWEFVVILKGDRPNCFGIELGPCGAIISHSSDFDFLNGIIDYLRNKGLEVIVRK
jgi:hypothetical protein